MSLDAPTTHEEPAGAGPAPPVVPPAAVAREQGPVGTLDDWIGAARAGANPSGDAPGHPNGNGRGNGNGGGGGRYGGGDDWDARGAPRYAHRRRRNTSGRRAVTAAVLAIDAAAVTLSVAGVGGPLRLLIGLAFVVSVPGWAAVGYLRLSWPAAEISLAVAASLAIVLLGSEVMLWVHAWHPIDLQLAVGAASAPALGGQLRLRRLAGVTQ